MDLNSRLGFSPTDLEGIEPPYQAPKACMLPLHHKSKRTPTTLKWGSYQIIEQVKSSCVSNNYFFYLVQMGATGFEPAICWSGANRICLTMLYPQGYILAHYLGEVPDPGIQPGYNRSTADRVTNTLDREGGDKRIHIRHMNPQSLQMWKKPLLNK